MYAGGEEASRSAEESIEIVSSAFCVADGSPLRASGADTDNGRRENELQVDWDTDIAEAILCTDTVEGVRAPAAARLFLRLLAEERTLSFHRVEALVQNFCIRRASFATNF